MNRTFGLGLVVGLGAGIALYFLVVYLLPMLGKHPWIWT